MSRFIAIKRLAWLIAKRHGTTRDLRRHFVRNYVERNLFAWETQQLRDERVEQEWLAIDNKIPFPILRHHIDHVEKWLANDVDDNRTVLHRIDTWSRGTLWCWVYRPEPA